MSMRTKISTLDKRYKNRIIAMLYNAMFSREDVTLMVTDGRLGDIADVIDLNEVFR